MDARTQEILDRFSKSWIETEIFYNDLIDNNPEWEKLIPLSIFIQKLKNTGGKNFFRLGTSLHHLIISRSVEPGLRSDQKHVRIEAQESSFIVTLKEGTKMYRQYTIKDLDDERLKGLLQTLKQVLID